MILIQNEKSFLLDDPDPTLPTLSIQENCNLQFRDTDNTWPECYTADHITYI